VIGVVWEIGQRIIPSHANRTENRMRKRTCSVDGLLYVLYDCPQFVESSALLPASSDIIIPFPTFPTCDRRIKISQSDFSQPAHLFSSTYILTDVRQTRRDDFFVTVARCEMILTAEHVPYD
jgi:hypothetical protein